LGENLEREQYLFRYSCPKIQNVVIPVKLYVYTPLIVRQSRSWKMWICSVMFIHLTLYVRRSDVWCNLNSCTI